MKTKNIKINIGKYKSLFPGILPSIDSDGNEVIFNNDSVFDTYRSGNYKMIVKDIAVPINFIKYDYVSYKESQNSKICFVFNDKNDICIDNTIYSISNNSYIINNKQYELNTSNYEFIPYSVLHKYYIFGCKYYKEITNDNNVVYESGKEYYNTEISVKTPEIEEYYTNLDNEFYSYGGKKMFDWLCKNAFFKYKIPDEFLDNWECEYLYYPDILRWKAWFNKHKNDTQESDCCNYQEYIKRGGEEFLNKLNEIKLPEITYKHEIPSIILHVNIDNNIDDIGIMSQNIKEWKAGENTSGLTYENGKYSNKYEDFITQYDNYAWISKYSKTPTSDETYIYDDVYKEIIFKEYDNISGWQKLDNANLNETESLDEIYDIFDIKQKRYIVFKGLFIFTEYIDCIKYNDTYYPVMKNDYNIPYIKDNSNKIITLLFDKTNKRYYLSYNNEEFFIENKESVNINGRVYFIPINGNNVYFLYKNNLYYSDIFEKYINIEGKQYIVNGNKIQSFDGYVTSETNDTMYYKPKFKDSEYSLDNMSFLSILRRNKTLLSDEVSGYTDSKLDALKPSKKCFDDVGNELPGMFIKTASDTYMQPTENSTLDILFHKGDTSGFELKKDDDDNVCVDGNNNTLYYGNIILDIKFYYKDVDGNIINDAQYDTLFDAIGKNNDVSDTFHCDITYLIGAVLTQIVEDDKTSYIYDENNSYGIKYVDSVKLNLKQVTYFLTTNISYPLYYYEMEYELNDTELSDYGNKKIESKKTFFTYKRNDANDLNIFQRIPVIKEEMYLGIATPPKVVDNINIDRGSSASLDKHLKLTEVGTMEALENYGNGIWNIHSNTE